MIIGLSGYARSGKDEVAKILVNKYGFKRVAFADTIKEFLLRVNPILDSGLRVHEVVKEHNWEIAKAQLETRRLMQQIGVVARDMFGPNFWVDQALCKFNPHFDNVVISDVRFKNELSVIRRFEGQIYRVIREGAAPVNNHISETELDNAHFDGHINNNGTLEDLEGLVDKLLETHANKIV